MNRLSNIQQTMSSREIAELTGKQHQHVMRDIRNCEPAYLQVYGTESRFGLSEYTDPTGRKLPEYLLTKSQTIFLVSGYDPILRAKIQKRWEDLESRTIALPSRKELALMVIEAEDKLELARSTIKDQAPQVAFAKAVEASPASMLMREFAKVLCTQGLNIGQNRMFSLMRKEKYLNKNNEPYQRYVDMGLFEYEEFPVNKPGYSFIKKTPKITGKGQLYFAKKLLPGQQLAAFE